MAIDLVSWTRTGCLTKVVLTGLACLLVVAAVLVVRTTAEAQSITNGSFIRQAGTDDVYRVKIVNGKWYKWLILNETAFCSYGCPWGSVHDVSRSVMNRYTTSNLARRGNDRKVWRFTARGDTGTRQWLNMTPAEFEAAGFDWDAVHSLTTGDFNEYAEGTVLTCSDFNVCAPSLNDCQISEVTSPLSLREGREVASQRVATVTATCRSASISGLPSGLSGSLNRSNRQVTINGTPAVGSAGTYFVTISANDETDLETFRITVTTSTTNPPPIVATRGNFTFERGEDVGSLWVATATDNEPLASRDVQVSGLPPSLRKADYSARSGRLRIEGTVSSNAREQTYTVTVSASDGTNTTRETFQITISRSTSGTGDCGNLGVLAAGEIKRVVGEWASDDPEDHPDGDGQRYFDRCRFELTSPSTVAIELSSDAADSSLTVASTASPRHMQTIQHGSPSKPARVSLTLPTGSYYIYAATLWRGHTGSYVLRATIAEPLEFDSEIGEITWQRGVERTRELPRASGGLTPYTYSLRTPSGDSAPEGMTFNADMRTLTGAPLGEVGRHRITYRVTDAMGFHAEQTFHLKYEEVACTDDRHTREEPLAPGETWTREGEWTSADCVTAASEFIQDHIGHYRDIYSFRVSRATEVAIDLKSDDVGTYIHLLDNSGQLVPLTDASDDGNNARVIAHLESGETHWIRATTRELGATGEYALTVSTSRLDLPLGHEEECLPENYDLGEISEFRNIDGRLEDGDCSSEHGSPNFSTPVAKADLYAFTLETRATVTVGVSTPSRWVLHRVLLADADGGEIAKAEGIRSATINLGEGPRFETINLRAATQKETLRAGDYWVEVAIDSDSTLDYDLQIEVIECSTTEIDLVATPHQTIRGRLAEDDCRSTPMEDTDSKWADMYTFSLAQPAYMEFTVDNTESNVNPDIRLFDGDSNNTGSLYGYGKKRVDKRESGQAVSKGWLSAGTWRLEVTKKGEEKTNYDLTVTRRMSVADKNTAKVIATKYAPTLKFDKGELFEPVPIETMLHYAELRYDKSGGKDPVLATGAGLLSEKGDEEGSTVLTEQVLSQYIDDGLEYFIDLDDDHKRDDPFETDDDEYWDNVPSVAYAYVADVVKVADVVDQDSKKTRTVVQYQGTVVQYWFFYLFNAATTGDANGRTGFDHEGDWEGIALYFDGENARSLQNADLAPDQVGFASHSGGFAATRRTTSDTAGEASAACGRMDVYVARNRHGSYPEKGKGAFHGYEGGQGSDVYGGDGVTWTPDIYAIRLIDTRESSWFHWPGKWGGGSKGLGVSGQSVTGSRNHVPNGPQFNGNAWFWHRPLAMVNEGGWGRFTYDCSHKWTPVGQNEEEAAN